MFLPRSTTTPFPPSVKEIVEEGTTTEGSAEGEEVTEEVTEEAVDETSGDYATEETEPTE